MPNMPTMAGWVARESATQYSYRKVCSLVLALGSSLRAIGVPGDGETGLDSPESWSHQGQAETALSSHGSGHSQPQGGPWPEALGGCILQAPDMGAGAAAVASFEPVSACTGALGRALEIQATWAHQSEPGLLGKSSIRTL